MGFDINEKINTELHYKDVALIATALGSYQKRYKGRADAEVLTRAKNLVDRLGEELDNNQTKRIAMEKLADFIRENKSLSFGLGFMVSGFTAMFITQSGREWIWLSLSFVLMLIHFITKLKDG